MNERANLGDQFVCDLRDIQGKPLQFFGPFTRSCPQNKTKITATMKKTF